MTTCEQQHKASHAPSWAVAKGGVLGEAKRGVDGVWGYSEMSPLLKKPAKLLMLLMPAADVEVLVGWRLCL